MDLVLIRHPEVAIDAGVCYGQTDVPLKRDVHELARELIARMQALNVPACVDGWHTSPLQRCALLAKALATDAHIDARLSEMHFGAWEDRAWDTIDRASIDEWAADVTHARPHGGESFAQFSRRVIEWFDETCAKRDEAVHVVAHAGVVRVLAAHLLGVERETALQWPLDFGAIAGFRRVRDEWLLVRWNA
ncbi:phosphoglycerate mutase family protein [Caballeronia hypogeia]|uniref:Alpha-ribazole phosphatase n=1 Tax=Caballeronia hypogeia TaxID=1777140 RepID=A0A157ZZ22_9BURK|nr:alpha-ribazole phosphatase [Caballeronia hypogeia]SAK50743.1 phosphoglycerate mutase family protein [Caballeronia hypogeia]